LAAARHPGRRRRLRAGLNPALVVVVAGIATGLLAGIAPGDVLALIGEAFTRQRYLALFLLTLPAIGLLERHGLKERAQQWIARRRAGGRAPPPPAATCCRPGAWATSAATPGPCAG